VWGVIERRDSMPDDCCKYHSRTIRGLIEGLEILAKYIDYGSDQDAFDFQHDVMYAGPGRAAEMAEEDLVRLGELGWRWDDELDSWSKFS
jgi:hypothetical protein